MASFNISLTRDVQVWHECAEMMSHSEPWITLGRDTESCLKSFGGLYHEVYVVKEVDKLLGFGVLHLQGVLNGYIQTICIDPGSRGKGIGTALIKFCEDRIFKDSPNVFMCVSSFNLQAQKLYEKLGYQKTGEFPDFIVSGASEMLLRKTTGPKSTFKNISNG